MQIPGQDTRVGSLLDPLLPPGMKRGPDALDVQLRTPPALVLVRRPLAPDLAPAAHHAGGLLGGVLHVRHGSGRRRAAQAAWAGGRIGGWRANWGLRSLGGKCIGLCSGSKRRMRAKAGTMDAGREGVGQTGREMQGRSWNSNAENWEWASTWWGRKSGDPGF